VRKYILASLVALLASGIISASAEANSSPAGKGTSSKLSLTARITSFSATRHGMTASGVIDGTLRSGSKVSHANAPVHFAVVAKASGGRCNVLSLSLAQLNLELLGVQVTTSAINLNVTAVKGEVLGNLFCALSRAKVTFPTAAGAARAMNAHMHGRSLGVFATTTSLPARTAQATTPQTCQVLNLVLGPLHLDLLGLVVDLYGATTTSPVTVTINAVPSQGLLGQLLCGVAGGGGITSLTGLQSLLNSLGLNLTTTQLQNLLTQLGITDLSSGLSSQQLNQILKALGLGSTTPTG
jgi:hypothetical protein